MHKSTNLIEPNAYFLISYKCFDYCLVRLWEERLRYFTIYIILICDHQQISSQSTTFLYIFNTKSSPEICLNSSLMLNIVSVTFSTFNNHPPSPWGKNRIVHGSVPVQISPMPIAISVEYVIVKRTVGIHCCHRVTVRAVWNMYINLACSNG